MAIDEYDSQMLADIAASTEKTAEELSLLREEGLRVRQDQPAAKVDVANLIEQLVTATIKLYKVCDRKAELGKMPPPLSPGQAQEYAEAVAQNMREDIALCQLRGSLKNQINQALGCGLQDVKDYGK